MEPVEIIIFSENRNIEHIFKSINLKSEYSITTHPVEDLYREDFQPPRRSFCYFDISGFGRKRFISILKRVNRKKIKYWGIIDPESVISDPAKILHHGGSDYINGKLLLRGIRYSRLNKLIKTIPESLKTRETSRETGFETIPSPLSWDNIQIGKEYTFCLMFIEIDNQDEIKLKLGDQQLEQAYSSFHNFLEKIIETANGKIWIWNTGGGIILFPFNRSIFSAIIMGMRLMLSRKIISIEHLLFGFPISYRIVFHLGNTVYMPRGKTGTIISDDINSLFHIGKRFARSGKLYFTEKILDYIPEGIKKNLQLCGGLENLNIYSLKYEF